MAWTRIAAVLLALSVGFSTASAQADVIDFILTGAAGEGLLEGNVDPATGEAGSGGIGSSGLYYDTDTQLLHIDIEWGSANGYTDLSQDVFKLHLHGPTAGSGAGAFGQTAPLMITLSGFDPSATSGGLVANFFIDDVQEPFLLDNRTYINVHLSDTDGGMIRGYMLAVPEPGATLPLLALWGGWLARRRRSVA